MTLTDAVHGPVSGPLALHKWSLEERWLMLDVGSSRPPGQRRTALDRWPGLLNFSFNSPTFPPAPRPEEGGVEEEWKILQGRAENKTSPSPCGIRSRVLAPPRKKLPCRRHVKENLCPGPYHMSLRYLAMTMRSGNTLGFPLLHTGPFVGSLALEMQERKGTWIGGTEREEEKEAEGIGWCGYT